MKFYAFETLSSIADLKTEFFFESNIQIEMKYNSKTQKIYIQIPEGSTLMFTNGIETEFGF